MSRPGRSPVAAGVMAGVAAVAVLAATAFGVRVAAASLHPATALYALGSARGGAAHAAAVDGGGAAAHVVWLLVLGSDARPGESVTGARADSIHLVGVNTATGAGIALGIPRDSYVSIPGNGRNKINAAMAFGGPELMAATMKQFTGIEPDYVVVMGFDGFTRTVDRLGGLHIDVPEAVHAGGADVDAGRQHLDGFHALWYGRARHGVPGGDFGRSMHQGGIMVAMLSQLQDRATSRTMLSSALGTLLDGLAVHMSAPEAYRLYQAAMAVRPAKIKNCVLPGGYGWAGPMSIVLPDRDTLAGLVADVRGDATLSGGCPKAF